METNTPTQKIDTSKSAYDRALANFSNSPVAWHIAQAVRDVIMADPTNKPVSATSFVDAIKSVLAAEMVQGRIEFTDNQGLPL